MKRRTTFEPRVREDGGPTPTEGGAEEELNVERASASPAGKTTKADRSVDPMKNAVAQGVQGPLPSLQSWFSQVMMHPESAEAGFIAAEPTQRALNAPTPEHIVEPNPYMTAAERMAIYQYAYHSRLSGCVKDDFETVGHAMGEEAFDEICLRYVKAYPSSSPNLNIYAQHFPEFIRGQTDLNVDPEFLGELARLEWAMIQVVHAPDTPKMDLSDLQAAAPEQWAGLKLFASPVLRFEHFTYPVNAYFQAVAEEENPEVPKPKDSATAIYRQDWRIWRMGFTPTTAKVLDALLAEQPLGEALALLGEGNDAADDTDVMKWFQEWMASGFFHRYAL